MEMDKIVNLDPEELLQQEHQAAEQVFRLRFQMRMGQNEGLKKLRELKKDLARIKTVQRQRELGETGPTATPEAAPKRKPRKAAKKSAKSKSTRSNVARSKKTSKDAAKAKKATTGRAKTAKRGKASAKRGS
jgi:large subunit ribosomal protein L29